MTSVKKYLEFKNNSRLELDPEQFVLQPANRENPGVFTTFSTFNIRNNASQSTLYRPAVFYFEYHLERLLSNAKALGILNPIAEHQSEYITNIVFGELSIFSPKLMDYTNRVRVRLVLNSSALLVYFEYMTPRWDKEKLVRLAAVNTERDNASIKSTDTAKATAARETVVDKTFDEALLIDRQGFVREGSWSNIFWFDNHGQLFTVKSNVLAGVTRRIILENNTCTLVDLTLEQLKQTAVEVFICQSTTGVIAVSHIDDWQVGTGKMGVYTKELQDRFWKLVEQRAVPVHPN